MTPLNTSDGVVPCHLSFLVKALKRDGGVNDCIISSRPFICYCDLLFENKASDLSSQNIGQNKLFGVCKDE